MHRLREGRVSIAGGGDFVVENKGYGADGDDHTYTDHLVGGIPVGRPSTQLPDPEWSTNGAYWRRYGPPEESKTS